MTRLGQKVILNNGMSAPVVNTSLALGALWFEIELYAVHTDLCGAGQTSMARIRYEQITNKIIQIRLYGSGTIQLLPFEKISLKALMNYTIRRINKDIKYEDALKEVTQ